MWKVHSFVFFACLLAVFIAVNVIVSVGDLLDHGAGSQPMRFSNLTRLGYKFCGLHGSATCVRVPTFFTNSKCPWLISLNYCKCKMR